MGFPATSTTTCSLCGQLIFNNPYCYTGVTGGNVYALTCDNSECKKWLEKDVIKWNVRYKRQAQFFDTDIIKII